VVSGIDYDSFRAKTWAERVSLFSAITAQERADLVRTHISQWLSRHREELTEQQISSIEEKIAFITPALYAIPSDEDLISRFVDLTKRTAMLLSREQARSAFAMDWGKSCATGAK
jgi:hypothetical protein